MKIIDALKELKDTWGYETEELNHIRNLLEEIGAENYAVGYADRRIDEKQEAAELTQLTLSGYHPPLD